MERLHLVNSLTTQIQILTLTRIQAEVQIDLKTKVVNLRTVMLMRAVMMKVTNEKMERKIEKRIGKRMQKRKTRRKTERTTDQTMVEEKMKKLLKREKEGREKNDTNETKKEGTKRRDNSRG